MATTNPKSTFRPDVQGLRGVAVLLVVIFHAGIAGFPGGYVGVDIFFVISGYLITGLLLREIERTGTVDFGKFFARRIRRLLPAATVVLVATVGAAWLVYSPIELKQFASSAAATAIYLSNVWFAHLSTDYLAEDTIANPLLHTWSLAVEEQFYLVWPFLLVAVARLGSAATLRPRLFCCLAVLAIVSLLFCVLLTRYNQPWAFFGSPTRAWEFAAGGLISLWLPRGWLSRPGTVRLIGVSGLILIVAAAAGFTARTIFPGYAALVPVLGAGLVIAAGHVTPAIGGGRWLSLKPLRFIGDISYSLYLWHWPIFVFLAPEIEQNGLVGQLAGLALAVLLAWLTYLLVENPFRFSQTLFRQARASIAMGILLSGSSLGLAMAVRGLSTSGSGLEAHRRYLAATQDIPHIYADGCHADVDVIDPPVCVFGQLQSTTTVVLFGDSHAAQWFPALKKLAERERWRLVSLTKSGCPSVSYAVYSKEFGRAYSECDTWRMRALARIGELGPAITIVSNSSVHAAGDREPGRGRDEAGWSAATRRTLAALASRSQTTIILRDTPWLPFSAPTCLSRATWRGLNPDRECTFDPHTENAVSVFAVESAALAASDQGFMVDMTDIICPAAPCVVDRNGLVLYRDAHHLTARFVEQIADPLYARLAAVVGRERMISEARP